ncbi:MAG TPA: cupin domain-containing protein, partial [Acidobacteriaceae bacterium]|nr:cupin domain-containing protein [Acidobacteriaceae bacterium]
NTMPDRSRFVPSDEFRRSFDTQPFVFHHNLLQDELLSFPALHRLARKAGNQEGRTSRKTIVRQPTTPGFLIAKGRGSLRWGTAEFHHALDDAFENFEESNIRLKLTAVHEYDGYRELLAESTRNLSEVTGVDFAKDYGPGIATFFIASPGETTPYHIDEEVNFLLQIHGKKHVHIFDGNDPKILSQKHLEQFWFGDCFIEQVPGSSCRTFDIEPGQGVFNPPFFPHIVETGSQACVSLSLGFARLRFFAAEVSRMNAYLRKFGWNPNPPGRRPSVDYMKSQFVRRTLSIKRSMMGS